MVNEAFEWDDRKAALNVNRHGVTFAAAAAIFDDPFAVTWLDGREDYGEDRLQIVGMIENRLLVVAYTQRGERMRIISARAAEPFERRLYHEG